MSESIEMLEAKFSNWSSENDVCDDGSWAHGAQSGFNFALEFIRQQEAELAKKQAKIEALYMYWLAVDDCEEGSPAMDFAVGEMYLAFDAEHKGPDGHRTWKDAAVAERVARVKAEAELATLRDQIKRAEEQEPVAWQNTLNGFIAKHQTAEYQIALVPKLYTKEPK